MRLDLLWSLGQVRTLDHFDELETWLQSRLHPDGYYYPPIQQTFVGWPLETAEPVPNTQRGALLHQVPPTHELVLREYPSKDQSVRESIAGFVIHCLGFITGRRCQFADWWIDGRLPGRPETDAEPLFQREVSVCLDAAVDTWKLAGDRERRVLTNALFMHNRSPSYEWSWERFIVEYQVFDAFYRISSQLYAVTAPTHGERFEALADRFGLFFDRPRIGRIVALRNELFHEALWVGTTPTSGGGEEGFYAPLWLRHINQRLGLAVLGFTGPYIESNWTTLIRGFLDLDQLKK